MMFFRLQRSCHLAALWMTCLLSTTGAIVPDFVSRAQYAEPWNAIEESIGRLNEQREELGESIRLSPPWRVRSDVKQQRRRELYRAIVREMESTIENYKRLERIDQ